MSRQAKNKIIQQLRRRLESPACPTTITEQERQPFSQLRDGLLVELLSEPGSGASLAAGLMVRQKQSQPLVIVDPSREFHPLAAQQMGLSLETTVVVHPTSANDHLWVLEQVLRSRASAAVISPLESVTPSAYRRLKLAVEWGGGCGLLLRSSRYRDQSSWADLRLLIEPAPLPVGMTRLAVRRLNVTVVGQRGAAREQQTTMIEVTDDARVVRVAAELAHSTVAAQSA